MYLKCLVSNWYNWCLHARKLNQTRLAKVHEHKSNGLLEHLPFVDSRADNERLSHVDV